MLRVAILSYGHGPTTETETRARAASHRQRLDEAVVPNFDGPVLGRANIAYELSERTKATAHGGMGMIAKLVDTVALAQEIDCVAAPA